MKRVGDIRLRPWWVDVTSYILSAKSLRNVSLMNP